MKAILRSGVAAAITLALSTSASAQIISTSIPKGPQGGGEEKNVSFHLMAGYTNWDFAVLNGAKSDAEDTGGSTSGGDNGFIVAGDLAFKASDSVTLGVGGWYNKVSDFDATLFLVDDNPQVGSFTRTIGSSLDAYSIYGSAFYKNVGVQAGLVHSTSDLTFSENIASGPFAGSLSASSSSAADDVNLFGVYRMSGERGSFSVGAGLYHNGSIDADTLRFPNGAELPLDAIEATTVFSAFVNGSLHLTRSLSLDASYWYIGSGAKEGEDKDNASRITVGIGLTL
jgi:hypothetical protein